MASREHLERLQDGVLAWNAWRREHPRLRPDLRQAALPDANLRGCDLRGADLRGASLVAANLRRADLREADLAGCDLRFCEWRGARLSGAKLQGAKGAEERMIAAAARTDWRERLPPESLWRAAAALAGLAVAWTILDRSYPDGVGAKAAAPAIGLAAVMSQAGLTAWTVEGVAISGGLMRLRLSADEMSQEAYVATLRAACRELEGRVIAPPVERIEVLRRDGEAGWLFEQAARCPQILAAPPQRLPLAVAAGSRPIRPEPGP